MTAWTDAVKKTFKQGRLSNPSYQFKNALVDAKKIYKKGESVAIDTVKKTSKAAIKVKKNVTSRLRKSMKGKKGKKGKGVTFKRRGKKTRK